MDDDQKPGMAYWKLIEPIWEKVSFYENWDILKRDFARITLKQRNLYAAHWANSEICNGGFWQLFVNSTGMLVPEAVVGYRVIGMINCAEIVHQACLRLGVPFPRERIERWERMDALFEMDRRGRKAFDDLDDKYYKIKDEEAGGFETAADQYAISG